MSDRLQELTVFARVAESGSFSRAARELSLSQPSVSRIVGELEARLGVTLLLRTTRRVVPTEAGAAFAQRARQVLRELEAAEDDVREVDSLRGTLKVAMPIAFGAREVIPLLPPFLARHTGLRLELAMSDTTQDLVAEGVDLAIRFGRLPDSGFGARRIALAHRIIVASPAYLAARGTPKTLADLCAHDCIFGPGGTSRQSWSLLRDSARTSIQVEGRIQVASAEGVVACVKAGLGIALSSQWMCRAEMDAGEIVQVLADHALEPVDVHAVFPAGPHPSAKVRAFVEHLAAALGADEGRDLTKERRSVDRTPP